MKLKTMLQFVAGLFSLMSGVAGAAGTVNVNGAGVAVGGYDVVAYFTAGAAVAGKADFAAKHEGATYHFSSAANRDLFRADPAKYVPQYGGYCAYGAAGGYKAPVDVNAWKIVEGKLYLNYDASVQSRWLKDTESYIRKADANWVAIRDK